jgi:RNA polymerase sigma-70 factor (ECF subfamily)
MLSGRAREPSPSDTSDAALLVRLGAREPSALAALYDRHARFALGVAHRVLGDRAEAEEVVQDVFLQIWDGRVRFDERRGRFRSWLFVMARNRALDGLRRRASRPLGEPPSLRLAARGDDAEQRAIDGEAARAVREALARLPVIQREAVELSFYRGLSHSEIARQTGEPLGTVKSRMSRAMAALREALGGAA